jgi:cytoskeletal protein CcmA (bactofilin family)
MAEIIKTIKSSGGGDYTSLAAWEAGEQGDLVAAGNIAIAECYNMEDTTAVVVAGWTTNSSNYIIIRGVASDKTSSNTGKWSTQRYRLVTTASGSENPSINLLVGYVKIHDLQIKITSGNNSNSGGVLLRSGCINAEISRCIIIQATASPGGYYSDGIQMYYTGQSTTLYAINCIIYGFAGSYNYGIDMDGSSNGTTYAYSCTFIKNYCGLARVSGTVVAKNCYSGGNTNGDYSGTITMTTCASSDTTGSTGLQSIAVSTSNFINVTADSEDYHLTSGSALKDVGTNTSGDSAPLNFTSDIDGNTRSGTWDVGADEYQTNDISISGDVQAQPATASGTVEVFVSASGDVSAQPATASGTISAPASMSGDVQAQPATANGTITVICSFSGDVQAQAATANGSLSNVASIGGDVQAQPATANGSIEILVSFSGNVQAANATATGTITTEDSISISGDVQAQPATANGSIGVTVSFSGDVQAANATATGTITVGDSSNISGDVQAQPATANGSIEVIASFSGNVQAANATASGQVRVDVSIGGDVQAQPATCTGTIITNMVAEISGDVQAQPATASGTVNVEVSMSGNVQAVRATASGVITTTAGLADTIRSIDVKAQGMLYIPSEKNHVFVNQPLSITCKTGINLSDAISCRIQYRRSSEDIGFINASVFSDGTSGKISANMSSLVNNRTGELVLQSMITLPFDTEPIPGKPFKLMVHALTSGSVPYNRNTSGNDIIIDSQCVRSVFLAPQKLSIFINQPYYMFCNVDPAIANPSALEIRYEAPDGSVGFLPAQSCRAIPTLIMALIPSSINSTTGEWVFRSWVTLPSDANPVPGRPYKLIVKDLA